MSNLITEMEDTEELGETYFQEVCDFIEELNSEVCDEIDHLVSIWDEFMGDFDKEIALVPVCEIC